MLKYSYWKYNTRMDHPICISSSWYTDLASHADPWSFAGPAHASGPFKNSFRKWMTASKFARVDHPLKVFLKTTKLRFKTDNQVASISLKCEFESVWHQLSYGVCSFPSSNYRFQTDYLHCMYYIRYLRTKTWVTLTLIAFTEKTCRSW